MRNSKRMCIVRLRCSGRVNKERQRCVEEGRLEAVDRDHTIGVRHSDFHILRRALENREGAVVWRCERWSDTVDTDEDMRAGLESCWNMYWTRCRRCAWCDWGRGGA